MVGGSARRVLTFFSRDPGAVDQSRVIRLLGPPNLPSMRSTALVFYRDKKGVFWAGRRVSVTYQPVKKNKSTLVVLGAVEHAPAATTTAAVQTETPTTQSIKQSINRTLKRVITGVSTSVVAKTPPQHSRAFRAMRARPPLRASGNATVKAQHTNKTTRTSDRNTPTCCLLLNIAHVAHAHTKLQTGLTRQLVQHKSISHVVKGKQGPVAGPRLRADVRPEPEQAHHFVAFSTLLFSGRKDSGNPGSDSGTGVGGRVRGKGGDAK